VKQPIQDIAAAAVAVLLNKQTAPDLDNPILFACDVLKGETTAPPQPD
jgi:LacI family transcriptional regulator